MDGEVYADFVLLWLVCHQSRVEAERARGVLARALDAGRARRTAPARSTRCATASRQAIETLGGGFLAHPANPELRDALRDGDARRAGLLPRSSCGSSTGCSSCSSPRTATCCSTRSADPIARERYHRHYSTRRPAHARRSAGGRPPARPLRAAQARDGRARQRRLRCRSACPRSAASSGRARRSGRSPARSSPTTTCSTRSARSRPSTSGVRRAVDYRNLGAEELGSVYESLLELHPDARPRRRDVRARRRRRHTSARRPAATTRRRR